MFKSRRRTSHDSSTSSSPASGSAMRHFALEALVTLGEATNIGYLKGAAGLALLIVDTVESVGENQRQCLRVSERMVQLIMTIYDKRQEVNPDTSPGLIDDMERLRSTLEKFYEFLRKLATRSKMARYLYFKDDAQALQDCERELDHALKVFEVKSKIMTAHTVAQLDEGSDRRQNDVMSTLRMNRKETLDAVRTSMISECISEQSLSPTSSQPTWLTVTTLPPSPKIFHGRNKELGNIIELVVKSESARVAICGPGGIGKSTLARSLLHSKEVVRVYGPRRHFVACDSAKSRDGLVSTLAAYFSLAVEQEVRMEQLSSQIISMLSSRSERSIIVLDNFESPWEPLETRAEVEDFLSALSGIDQMTLIVTLRGAQRPSGTQWTRPCPAQLGPLELEAARQTFVDISDISPDHPQLDKLIALTDNLPLAVTLMANIAEYEDPSSLLRRWDRECTAMLSRGQDPRTNLDVSIKISLDSPRMTTNPHAGDLLSLMCILPDGLALCGLQKIASRLKDTLRGATVLRQTSLAYDDGNGRLRILDPIRAYICTHRPPSPQYLSALLDSTLHLVSQTRGIEKSRHSLLVTSVALEIGNIQAVLEYALEKRCECTAAIEAALVLARFQRYTSLGSVSTLQKAAAASEQIGRQDLQADCLCMIGHLGDQGIDPRGFEVRIQVLEQAIDLCGNSEEATRLSCQADCLVQLGLLCIYRNCLSESVEHLRHSFSLYEKAGDVSGQAEALLSLARLAKRAGDLQDATRHALKALSRYQTLEDLAHEAICKQFLAEVAAKQSDYTKATTFSAEAIHTFKAMGLDVDRCVYHAYAVACLGNVSFKRSKLTQAKEQYLIVLQIYRKLRRRDREADALVHLAYISFNQCDIRAAEEYLDTAMELWRDRLRNTWGQGCCVRGYGDIAFRQSNVEKASRLYRSAIKMFRETQHKDYEAECLVRLGDIALATSNTTAATTAYTTALALFRSVQQLNGQVVCLKKMGDVLLQEEEVAQAEVLYLTALPSLVAMGVLRDEADCRLRLGDIASRRRHESPALAYWHSGMELYRAAENLDGAKCCLDRVKSSDSRTLPC